jgi:ATP-dependent Clp protease ATP-binding subunit ClpB
VTSALAQQGKLDPVIGRDEEIRRVIQILSRRTKNNPVLIGQPGVGKTAIVEAWPSASYAATCPRPQGQAHRLLDMGALVAGAGTAASSKSGSRRCSRPCRSRRARSSSSSTKLR